MKAIMLPPIPQGTSRIASILYKIVTTIAKRGITAVKIAAIFLEV
jgi:hypothetical protein